jgi:hypothetical protein
VDNAVDKMSYDATKAYARSDPEGLQMDFTTQDYLRDPES